MTLVAEQVLSNEQSQVMAEVMSSPYKIGSKVKWRDSTGRHRQGVVREIYLHRVSRDGPGGRAVRAANRDDPAYLIEEASGEAHLRSHSELRHKDR